MCMVLTMDEERGERSRPHPEDSGEIRRGRPRVGADRSESPVVKGRVTAAEFEALREIIDATGRGQSQLVRRGIQLVIMEHREARDLVDPESADPERPV